MKLLAKLLATEWVRAALYRIALEDEYGHLYSPYGDLYMGRWALIRTGTRASKVLSFVTRGKYDHARIHWIRHPDRDREKHDHPFTYRTYVLDGWYREEFIPAGKPHKHGLDISGPGLRQWQGSSRYVPEAGLKGRTEYRILRAGDTAAAPLGQFHRIAAVADGGVYTLFLMGKDHGDWGFLVDGRWMKSSKFFQLRKIDHDGRRVA